jgi:uncharacterized membrane protein
MGYYQPQDYVIYIGILIVVIWILLKVFSKIKLDKKFVYAISPYILVGVLIRVFADTGTVEFNQWWSVTPGVYILAMLIAWTGVGIGYAVQKVTKIGYHITSFVLGTAFALLLFWKLCEYMVNPATIFFTLAMTLSLTFSVYALSVLFKSKLFQNKYNLLIMFGHLLDGSSTFIAHDYYGFYEEHILPNIFIDLAGDTAAVMIPIKIIIVTLTLYFMQKWYNEEPKTERNRTIYIMLKLLIFIVGFGPGARNTLLPALNL